MLWLIPAIPFLGSLILSISGGRLSKTLSAIIGTCSIGISAIITIVIGIQFLHSGINTTITEHLWNWVNIDGFKSDIALRLDSLSLCFIFIITFVGFLIHLYSTEYMSHEEGFSRFFAYMNLFVGSMLTLVLADNLMLMYLGWEGVGVCSYLLIGFFYKDPANNYAARKAFIITRIGDTAMLLGLFILFWSFGTFNLHEIMTQAPLHWSVGSKIATIAALCLLGGAVGKSAQLPLQTWLPDAMAGPSPVSALIHAATMVTAGVYLIARTNVIFMLSPFAQSLVAIIGTLTLLIAGISALTQTDIKRVLAYSTISQIGYMFLALGVGAFSAGVFHFMIHAFFKALLFLGAGTVIMAQHHEQNMFKMGGLRKKIPVVFWTFLIGSASLAALPLITAGFYSKDMIIWYSFAGKAGSIWLWAGAVVGAFLTAIYTFRMVFVTFYGESKIEVSHFPGKAMTIPLVILAVLSLVGGFVELPDTMGHLQAFSAFVAASLPPVKLATDSTSTELLLQLITAALAIGGVYIAYNLFVKRNSEGEINFQFSIFNSQLFNKASRFALSGLGFDSLYNFLFVRPVVYLSQINKNDFVDSIIGVIPTVNVFFSKIFKSSQTGQIRTYIFSIVLGIIIILTIVLIYIH